MNYSYPLDQQQLFTNRQLELAELAHYRHSLTTGAVEHVALFGLRRIGKTLLLKEFIRRCLEDENVENAVTPIYMDFNYLSSSPENFALGYVGQICYWALTQGSSDPEPFLNPQTLPVTVLQSGGNDLLPALQSLLQELNRARPDRQSLLRQAFRFPREVINARGGSLLLIFDEFQEIKTLANFPNSRNVLALLRAEIQSQSGTLYVLAGSAVSILSDMLSNPESPLFAQFTRLSVNAFSRQDTNALVRKLTSDQDHPDLGPLIHNLTGGHPYYITALSRRLMTLVEVVNRPMSADTVKQAFLVETLSPLGRIYDFCRYVYDLSLQKATGYGSLKAVLQMLAAEEGLTISEIARRLHVTSGSASDYLRWLREVDLVVERDRAYYYQDPVLRFWVANVIKGIEISLTSEPLDLVGLVARLDTQFQRVSQELGIAQESAIREAMRHFAGQQVDGALLGHSGPVVLPPFIGVDTLLSPDGQVQIDALGRTATGDCWSVEVKWRNKRAGRKELEKLHGYAQDHSAQGWFVSRAGFTGEAIDYARRVSMYISNGDDFRELQKLVS